MNQPIYLLGGAQTDFARNWAREDLEIFDMFAEVLRDGVANAGIEPGQIEVGHVGNFVGDLFTGQGLIGGFFAQVYPELAGLPTSRHEAACASGSIAVLSAMRARCRPICRYSSILAGRVRSGDHAKPHDERGQVLPADVDPAFHDRWRIDA